VPRLGKLYRLPPREEQDTQDWRPRVYQLHQQAAVRLMEDLEGHSISELFRPVELASIRRLKPGKPPGLDSFFPELGTQRAIVPYLCCVSKKEKKEDFLDFEQ